MQVVGKKLLIKVYNISKNLACGQQQQRINKEKRKCVLAYQLQRFDKRRYC